MFMGTILNDPNHGILILCGLILSLPLLAFVLARVLSPSSQKWYAWLATGLVFLSFLLALLVLVRTGREDIYHGSFPWFSLNSQVSFSVGFLVNSLTALMLVVVTFISFLVHLFSLEYMKGDPGFQRYFGYLGLFAFSMLGIVLADNLLLVFVFWELVGLSSYLLIGFWRDKPEASKAAQKAFIVNRIGDLGFIIGLMIIWSHLQTFDLQEIKSQVLSLSDSTDHSWLTWAGIALFCGAVGKSAQFPLQVWLPDAMEGPTPVSALIHAATMVAAGVFLLARVFSLFTVEVFTWIAFTGAITAFMGAVAAIAQNDIKKVLAFSTISQLGYMVVGMGAGAYDAAIFHLFTHAFFKACLFLGAGSVIHALHRLSHDTHQPFNAQDMRIMGGLSNRLPVTFYSFTLAALSLIGVPLFSGFLSKDAIISGAWAWASLKGGLFSVYHLVPVLALLTVLLTAFYMSRQWLLVFMGESRLVQKGLLTQVSLDQLTERPWVIRLPLIVLGALSLAFFFGLHPLDGASGWIIPYIGIPETNLWSASWSWSALMERVHALHLVVSLASITLIAVGGGMAYFKFKPRSKYAHGYGFRPEDEVLGWNLLSRNNWYLDLIYERTVVHATLRIATMGRWIEAKIIDRAVNGVGMFNIILAHIVRFFDRAIVDGLVNLLAKFAGAVGQFTRNIQGGKIQGYFIWVILGMFLILLFYFI